MNFAARHIGIPYCPRNINGLNCWGLVAEYYTEKGKELPNYTIGSVSHREIASAFTAAFLSGEHGFKKIKLPVDGDLVLFKSKTRHHCGLLLDGKVLHSTPVRGVVYQSISDVEGFTEIEYWSHDKN